MPAIRATSGPMARVRFMRDVLRVESAPERNLGAERSRVVIGQGVGTRRPVAGAACRYARRMPSIPPSPISARRRCQRR